MSSLSFLDFLLLVLLPQVSCGEAEPLFRAEGSVIELGYCFGVDYIVVYRSGPEGDQLLGNSSADHTPIAPPADLQDRIHINNENHLLGLQISNLINLDSGTYRRECWENHTLVSQHTHQLSVCEEEVSSVEILQREDAERTELLCNHTSSDVEGTTVRWFREKYPSYKTTLFLDSSVSLDVLLEELQGLVEVRERGALLLLDRQVFKSNHHFYCMVMKGQTCLTYQNMFLPDRSDSRAVYSSRGDRVVLNCPAEGISQQWETPLGKMDADSSQNKFMFLRFGVKSKDFSLVIPAASDEHSGDYSCLSSTLEVHFLLVLCPKVETQEQVFVEGRNVSLECNVSRESPQRVQWYRLDPSGKHELIHDSNDIMAPIPTDLTDRLILSEDSSSLSITDLEEGHEGVYWCVVLRGSEVFIEEGVEEGVEDDYDSTEPMDYTDGDGGDYVDFTEDSDLDLWPESSICMSKQETKLVFNRTNRSSPTSDPPPGPNTTIYVVVGVLGGLLLLGVGAAVFVLRRRTNTSPSQSDAAASSALNTASDKNPMEASEYTDAMLSQNDGRGDEEL